MADMQEAGSEAPAGTQSVVIERDLPHPPERIWRALTQPHLVEAWLMKADIRPAVGHRFDLRMEPQPGRVFAFDCEVLAAEPNRILSYRWDSAGDEADGGLRSIVTWTLTPTKAGTLLRMEQSGFRSDRPHFHRGARGGWQRYWSALEELLARIE